MQGTWKLSVLFLQFFFRSKTVLKLEVFWFFFLKKKLNHFYGDNYLYSKIIFIVKTKKKCLSCLRHDRNLGKKISGQNLDKL